MNNVVADKSGNVYRRDPQGNWQQRQGNQWKPQAAAPPAPRPSAAKAPEVIRPSAPVRPSVDTARLNQEYQARERGQVRTQQFQQLQSASTFRPSAATAWPSGGVSRPGGGAGALRGGGAGGRRR